MGSLYGLIGARLQHSVSPLIHTRIFERYGLDAHYHLFEIEAGRLASAVTGLKTLHAVGVNITIPYKIEIIPYLDRLSPEAAAIGSVNTLHFTAGGAVGYNTDYDGFGRMLDRFGLQISGRTAVILGNGGAAKSVLRYLLDNGIRQITIAQRKPADAASAQADSRLHIIQAGRLEDIKDADLLINCTPCGMYPNTDALPLEKELIKNYKAAVDLIYNPGETQFLKLARKAGLEALNGLYMLVAQAVSAQEKWNGIRIDPSLTEAIYAEVSKIFE